MRLRPSRNRQKGALSWLSRDVALLVTIDVECDKGAGWRPHDPLAFRSVTEGVGRTMRSVFLRHGVKPTYFLSPEVMRDPECRELLRRLSGEAELATHLHPEHADARSHPADVGPGLFQCRLPPGEEQRQLESLTALFQEAFGVAPAVVSGGPVRRWKRHARESWSRSATTTTPA